MPLLRGLAETRRDGCLASLPPKTGDRAGLAHPRRSNLAIVVVKLTDHSRQRDGCGRLGNYSVSFQTRSGKSYSVRSRPSRLAATAIERALCFQIKSPLGS